MDSVVIKHFTAASEGECGAMATNNNNAAEDDDDNCHKVNQTDEQQRQQSLMQAKTELFYKLIGNQPPQQMIVTTPSTSANCSSSTADGRVEDFKLTVPLGKLKKSHSCEEQQRQQQLLQQTQQQPNQRTRQQNYERSSSGCGSSRKAQSFQHNHQSSLTGEDLNAKERVEFTGTRNIWYTNEEVATLLTSFKSHPEWLTHELQVRPKSGAVLLYSREKVRYRQDGYCWKKRKNGRTTREDHMKLKVQGIECIYGCYVHSALLPTFHRRCYWLLQNPDIVLVHYLNQPPADQNKMMITFNSSLLEADTRRAWTNEEIIEEIGSVFGGISQIYHNLNVNFPLQATIVPTSLPAQSFLSDANANGDATKMIESSTQSQPTNNTGSSNEQVIDVDVNESQQVMQQDMVTMTTKNPPIPHQESDDLQSTERDFDGDELMSVGHDSNDGTTSGVYDTSSTTSANQVSSDLPVYASPVDTHKLQQQQNDHHQHKELMTYDLVVEQPASIDQSDCCQPNELNCLQYNGHTKHSINASNLVNSDCKEMVQFDGESSARTSTDQCQFSIDDQSDQMSCLQYQQNPCSPVTQIYNEIVEDIETYALPIETDQYDPRHNHLRHLSASMSSLPIQQPMNDTTCVNSTHNYAAKGQQYHYQSTQLLMNKLPGNTRYGLAKDQSSCMMDLAACDLLIDESYQFVDQATQAGESQSTEDEDNLLLSEFNLHANNDQDNPVVNGLDAAEAATLANDDLRDLMLDTSSSGPTNILMDGNAFDLFNFRSTSCSELRQPQLDVRSTTSDDYGSGYTYSGKRHS